MSKLTPSSLFYLPCQAQNPENSFFTDFNDANRVPLDPYVWAGFAANHARPSAPEPVIVETKSAKPVQPMSETSDPKLRLVRQLMAEESTGKWAHIVKRREEAIEMWRSATPKNGNSAFFKLVIDLRNTGASLPEIETILWQEADQGRHPSQRRSQIKSIMRTLAKRPDRLVA